MDTKNVIAAISLSAAVIILYSLFWAPTPQELKEAKAKARREAMRRQQEMMENIKLAAGVGVVMAIGMGLLIFLLTIM